MITFKINEMITQEEKIKIVSLYYGQFIGFDIERAGYPHMLLDGSLSRTDYIQVKSLSDITDEDAIGILGKRFGELKFITRTPFTIRIVYYPSNSNRNEEYTFNLDPLLIRHDQADYLRSKGYALPAFGYSVDQLIEAGVFKLIKQ